MDATIIADGLGGFFSKPTVKIIVFVVIVAGVVAGMMYLYSTYKQTQLTTLDIELRKLQLQKARTEQ